MTASDSDSDISYTCEPCNLSFIDSDKYDKHIYNVHKRTIKECTICNITMFSSAFAKHSRSKAHLNKVNGTCSEKVPKEMFCEECGNFILKKHKARHQSSKKHLNNCSGGEPSTSNVKEKSVNMFCEDCKENINKKNKARHNKSIKHLLNIK